MRQRRFSRDSQDALRIGITSERQSFLETSRSQMESLPTLGMLQLVADGFLSSCQVVPGPTMAVLPF